MLKLVTLIVDPVPGTGDSSDMTSTRTGAGVVDDSAPGRRSALPGSLCIETQLSESKAQLLVEMLLGLERNSEHDSSEDLITTLIRGRMQELNEPHGHLFDKILSNVERIVIQHAFEDCDRVQTKAADRLGIDRNTLHKKLRKYNLLRTEPEETPSTP